LVAQLITSGQVPERVPDSWLLDLGRALRETGDLKAAATVTRASIHDGASRRQLETLAKIEDDLGMLANAIELRERIAREHGSHDPRARYLLAHSYQKAGHWRDAALALLDNIVDHPRHAASFRVLAMVARSMATWNGTFVNALANPAEGMFEFGDTFPKRADSPITASDPAEIAVQAMTRAADLQPQRANWQVALGDALALAGRPAEAVRHYAAAVQNADASNERWALPAKQRWQFHLEHARHAAGRPHVQDPLFYVEFTPAGRPPAGQHAVPGLFLARLTYMGLAIEGVVLESRHSAVELYLNGQLLRVVNVTQLDYLRQFSVTIKRNAFDRFPTESVVEVRTLDGETLPGPGGAPSLAIRAPHGDGTILTIIEQGGKLDKKGEIRPSAQDMRRRQDRDLEIYSSVREFFEHRLRRSLFLLYGTLLGYHRDGDLIPGDDDFDAGYVSDHHDPVAVKEETKEIIIQLVRAGFTVSFNRKGRLFRIQLERTEVNGCHVDIHPIWFQHGNVWIHNVVSMPSTRDDFLPTVHGQLRGVLVSAPRRAEIFLRGNYGPGWTTPDPGFRYYPSEVDPAVMRNLERALISVSEYRELASRIEREVGNDPRAGHLVSLGSQNLYPLDEFIP
jgi:tetratricopeptide (TPR) repeat protein